MEGVQDPTIESKGKGKAQEGDGMEESNDDNDDSSDESGVEDQVGFFLSHFCIWAQTANLPHYLGGRRYNSSASASVHRMVTNMTASRGARRGQHGGD